MPDWRATVRERLLIPELQRHRRESIVEELAAQLEEAYSEALARGAGPAEANAEVERHVADWERLSRDVSRAERSRRQPAVQRWLDELETAARRGGAAGRLAVEVLRDVRYALRGLRRAPGFTAAVVLVLALGIGAATAMFAAVDALLLKPLPYPDPDRLMTVWTTYTNERRSTTPISGPNFEDLRARTRSFAELGVQTMSWVNLAGGARPERVRAAVCTAALLRALAIPPAKGRIFTDREVEDGERVAVLGDRLWRSRFGGDESIVGSTVTINGDGYEVVGVMPPGFTTPRPYFTSQGAELWLPVALRGSHAPRNTNWLFALGRLAPGVTRAEAEGEVASIAAGLVSEYPDVNAFKSFWIMPLAARVAQGTARPLTFLIVGASLLLLIAAVNAAGIAFARAAARQTLAAIRASQGAGRGRLVRQLVTENLVLAAGGGLVGLAVAWGGVGVLRAAVPATFQRAAGIALDPRALGLAGAVTVAIGLAVGLAVGLAHSRERLASVARDGSRTLTRGRQRTRLLGGMVAVQLALTLVLANGTALMMRSYLNAVRTPLAADTAGTLTAGITLEGSAYRSDASVDAFWRTLLERVRALPGVEAVALVSKLPLNGGTNGSVLVGSEAFDPAQERPLVEFSYATRDYFAAMGIPLVRGRALRPDEEEGAAIGLIVNRTFVERVLRGGDPLGRVLREDARQSGWSGRIVGVVEDVPQWGLERETLPEVYFPFTAERITSPWLVVGTGGPPAAAVGAIREIVASLDPGVPVSNARTMAEVVAADVHPRRMMTQAIALFALVAFVLGATGVYGMVAYDIARRRHEIGIRMAVGAARRQVVVMVVRKGARLAAAGVGAGLLVALATARLLEGLLLGVAPLDPSSLAAVAVAVSATAAAGTILPARRAAAVDPAETLRAE